MRRDDDEPPASLSSQERFTRADQGRREELKRKIERQEGRAAPDSSAQELSELKAKVDLQKLQKDIGAGDDKTKTFGTKTIREREEEKVETAQVKPSPDRQIEKAKLETEKKDQAGEEYQQQVG